MKKIIGALALALLLSGCATYKFHRGQKPYEKGYVVSRYNYTILEYTVGKDNSVPEDMGIARKRFKRRHRMVEHYYKKMGEIENRFKETFFDPPIMFLKFIGGVFRFPCILISDYRYEHNPKYREKIKKKEQEQDEKEAARIARFKEKLNNYIQKDLTSEQPVVALPPIEAPAVKEQIPAPPVTPVSVSGAAGEKPPEQNIEPIALPQTTPPVAALPESTTQPLKSMVESPGELTAEVEREQKMAEAMQEPPLEKKKKKERPAVVSQPKAVIIAKPLKGYSPLRVHFYGSKSRSIGARITSYLWDFGDGDTSNKPNPINTYYSASYDPKHFALTLTVTDSQGNTDTAHMLIEVLNK